MADSAEFFSGVKQKKDDAIPEGMMVWEYKHLKWGWRRDVLLNQGDLFGRIK